MTKQECRHALKIVLSEHILPALIENDVNFSVLWKWENLKVIIPKKTFKMLRKSDNWFSGIKFQKTVLSIIKINPKDGSPEHEVTILGKLYISSPEIVLILTAELK